MELRVRRKESNRFQYIHSNSPKTEIFYDGDDSSLSSDNASSPFYLSLSEAVDSDDEEEEELLRDRPKKGETKKLTVRFEEASIKKDSQDSDNVSDSENEEYEEEDLGSSNSDSSYNKGYGARRQARFKKRKKRPYPKRIENRVMWTEAMMNNLLEGVNTVGRGRWKEIWDKYDFPEGVTVIKVANKWHYMTRRNLVACVGGVWVLKCKLEELVDRALAATNCQAIDTSKMEAKTETKNFYDSSSEDEFIPPAKKKIKRPTKPVMWSLDMVNTLVDAVNDCGKGHWSDIVNKYHFPFDMTAKKVGDKWTHLARKNFVKMENNRWVLTKLFNQEEDN